MPRIDLGAEEAPLLREMLESYLSDLRMEIADTDSFDFRQELKRREALLRRIIDELAADG